MAHPLFSTLPKDASAQIEALKEKLASNTKPFVTLALCSTPSVSNTTFGPLYIGIEKLGLVVKEDPKALFLNWYHGGHLNPSEDSKYCAINLCPQAKQLMQLAANASIDVAAASEGIKGIKVEDPDFWLKSILKAGFSFYDPKSLPDVDEYSPKTDEPHKDKLLSVKNRSSVPTDILDSETGLVVKTTLTLMEGRHVAEGETYIYKFATLPDGSIPRIASSGEPALVWGNKREEKSISKAWQAITSLLPKEIDR